MIETSPIVVQCDSTGAGGNDDFGTAVQAARSEATA
jgi:hypothetical protein